MILSRLSNSSLKNLPLVVYKLRKFKKKNVNKASAKTLIGRVKQALPEKKEGKSNY